MIFFWQLTFGKENSVMVVNPTGALTFAPNAGNVRTEYDLSKFEVTGLNMVRFKVIISDLFHTFVIKIY